MQALVITALSSDRGSVRIVELKGLGHPDTICNALAENLSRKFCRAFRDRFGGILHHNVEKALLCGGRSTPAFGAGIVNTPIGLTDILYQRHREVFALQSPDLGVLGTGWMSVARAVCILSRRRNSLALIRICGNSVGLRSHLFRTCSGPVRR
jgi:hypothetical protein